MILAESSLELMARGAFIAQLEQRLSRAGWSLPESGLSPNLGAYCWDQAGGARCWGIESIGGSLILTHALLELGEDGLNKLPAMRAVLDTRDVDEFFRLAQLWHLRCLLLAALQARPGGAVKPVGAFFQDALAAASPMQREQAALVARIGVAACTNFPELDDAALSLASICPAWSTAGYGSGFMHYLRQPLDRACVVPVDDAGES